MRQRRSHFRERFLSGPFGLVLLLFAENILWVQTLKLEILSEKYTFPVGIEPTSH